MICKIHITTDNFIMASRSQSANAPSSDAWMLYNFSLAISKDANSITSIISGDL